MSSEERFNRTLMDRYDVFKKQLDQTVGSFAQDKLAESVKNAERLSFAGRDLLGILVERDRPPWLVPITDAATSFVQHKQVRHGQQFLETAMRHYRQVAPIVIADISDSYDFDRLYERLRDKGKLPELFDKMIEAITGMIDSGEIDSVTVVTALQRLLAVLKANRNGSYVAITRSLDYARFIRNFGLEFLKRIPGIRELVDAYEKTMKDADEEHKKLEERLRNESIHMIIDRTMFARLQQLPEKQPLLLGGPAVEEEQEPQEPVPDEPEAGEANSGET